MDGILKEAVRPPIIKNDKKNSDFYCKRLPIMIK